MPGDVFEQCSEDWARPLEREHDRDLVPGAKMVRWPAVGTSWRSIGGRPCLLSALEAALEDFPGCAVIISHDRFFLDRIATHILAFEGDSHVEWFEGNFADYEEDKKRRLGDAAVEPHRIKFKRFERD